MSSTRPRRPEARAALTAVTAVAAAAAALLLGACAVGPDFKAPPPPAAQDYAPDAAGIAAAGVTRGAAVPQRWWQGFGSRALDELVDAALAANPNVAAAEASLQAAQQAVAAQRGLFFPTLQASYQATRTKVAGNLASNAPGVQGNGSDLAGYQGPPASAGGTAPFNAPVLYNFHTAQLTVGYTPDVFGANRRLVEQAEAQAEVQRMQLDAARTTLVANLVAAAVQDAALREQLRRAEAMAGDAREAVALVQRQLDAGYASRLDLAAQQGALAQAEQQLAPLRRALALNADLLRALAGRAQDQAVPAFALADFALPRELPLVLPSQLVARRPDVRAAAAEWHAASAGIGVARAARLPQLAIDGSFGGAANVFSQMFWRSGQFFELAGNAAQTLFDGGAGAHREAAAEAAAQSAAAQYQATVLAAFQNVADTLHAIAADAPALATAEQAEAAAAAALALTQRQLDQGWTDRLALLAARQQQQQAAIARASARALQLGDAAALFEALGGAWWDAPAAPR